MPPRLTPGRPDRRRDLRRQQCETIHRAKRESLHQEALDAGEEALERLSRLGVSGHGEIDLCLAVAEARDATGRTEEGRTLLRETLRGLRRRMDDIPSAEARVRYLTEIPIHARLLSVAREWLGDEALRDAGLIVEVRC